MFVPVRMSREKFCWTMQRDSCRKEYPLEVRSKPGANYCAGLSSWRGIEVLGMGAAILHQDATGQIGNLGEMFASAGDFAGST
jgi:hypothetical protein